MQTEVGGETSTLPTQGSNTGQTSVGEMGQVKMTRQKKVMLGLDVSPGKREVEEWQNLVSLWDRMEGHVVMHEAPSCLEVMSPNMEGWLLVRLKGHTARRYVVLKRAHLLVFESPDGQRPLNHYLLRHARLSSKDERGHPLAPSTGSSYPFSVKLQQRTRVVLSAYSSEDLDAWRYSIVAAICRAASDTRACLPLACTPTIVKERAMRGVPDCFRGIVWQKLAGSHASKGRYHPTRYEELLQTPTEDDGRILRDLARTMPEHPFFSVGGKTGQQLIYNICHAYAVHDPEVGYCQGINFLGAVLLLHMRQESAFWTLVQLMWRYRMRGMFIKHSPMLAVELHRLNVVLEKVTPELHKHLQAEGLDVCMYTSQWVLTLFSYRFPLGFCFRVWDSVLVKGLPFAVQVSIAILKHFTPAICKLRFEEIIFFLKGVPQHFTDPKFADSIIVAAHHIRWGADLQETMDDFTVECIRKDKELEKASAASKLRHEETTHVALHVQVTEPASERRQPDENDTNVDGWEVSVATSWTELHQDSTRSCLQAVGGGVADGIEIEASGQGGSDGTARACFDLVTMSGLGCSVGDNIEQYLHQGEGCARAFDPDFKSGQSVDAGQSRSGAAGDWHRSVASGQIEDVVEHDQCAAAERHLDDPRLSQVRATRTSSVSSDDIRRWSVVLAGGEGGAESKRNSPSHSGDTEGGLHEHAHPPQDARPGHKQSRLKGAAGISDEDSAAQGACTVV